jgi:hypothetical protein
MTDYSPSKKLDIERTMMQLGSVEGSWQELMEVFPAYASTIKKHFHIMEAEGKIARIRPEAGRQRWKYEWIGPDEVEQSGERRPMHEPPQSLDDPEFRARLVDDSLLLRQIVPSGARFFAGLAELSGVSEANLVDAYRAGGHDELARLVLAAYHGDLDLYP